MGMRIITSLILRRIPLRRFAAGALLALGAAAALGDPGVYQTPEAFLAEAFPDGTPEAKALWLRTELRDDVARLLDAAPAPRLRYWQRGTQSAWILEAVGKDQPITAGVVVRDGAIADVRVLVFRESRGWEIKHRFFTRQFQLARLTDDGDLSRSIDGITGATLSVRAMKRIARTALLLDARTRGVSDLASAQEPAPQ